MMNRFRAAIYQFVTAVVGITKAFPVVMGMVAVRRLVLSGDRAAREGAASGSLPWPNVCMRNKAAYIVGQAVNGADVIPFVIPVLNNEHGAVCIDTLLMDDDDMPICSVSRRVSWWRPMRTTAVVRLLADAGQSELISMRQVVQSGQDGSSRLYHLCDWDNGIAPVKGMVMISAGLSHVLPGLANFMPPPGRSARDRQTRGTPVESVLIVRRMADAEYSAAFFSRQHLVGETDFRTNVPSLFQVRGTRS